MKLLSIDTSTKKFSLAVSQGKNILACRNITLNKILSSSIIPRIRGILKDSGVALKALDGFAVGLGPGSFTSLRVGLSTVKGLAFATGKPVVGVPSLDILAGNVQEQKVQICTVCDAKRNLVYACLYQKQGSRIKRKTPYLLTNIDDLLERIKEETLFIGDGVALYREAILKETPARFSGEKDWFPRAGRLAGLALEQFRKKKYSNIDKLVPLYLYPQDCQVRR